MNHFVHETPPPVPSNDTNPGIKRIKSGKWVAKIQHPISKVWVLLGAYTTPEEAADICTRKTMEYESHSLQDSMATSFNTSVTDFEGHPGVKLLKSGKWGVQIRHKDARIWLGTYTTPKEAVHSYIMSKLELDSQKNCKRKAVDNKIYDAGLIRPQQAPQIKSEAKQSKVSQQRQRHAYKRSSGRWQTEIRNPITKARVYLGTFDTADEAEEAYDNKRREFDLMVCARRKKKQLNDECEGDVIAQGKSNSKCVSNEPFVLTHGSSVTNVKVESVPQPIFGSETTREFDLNVVDSYGRLIGEYCRLDDEMWLC